MAKQKNRFRHFWAEGLYLSTVSLNEAMIRKYIQKQERDDKAVDKLSAKEYEDPFAQKTPLKGGSKMSIVVCGNESQRL